MNKLDRQIQAAIDAMRSGKSVLFVCPTKQAAMSHMTRMADALRQGRVGWTESQAMSVRQGAGSVWFQVPEFQSDLQGGNFSIVDDRL